MKGTIYLLLAVAIVLLSANISSAQQTRPSLREKLVFGGNVGGYWDGDYANISIQPTVGYKFNSFLTGYVMPGYSYYSEGNQDQSTWSLGAMLRALPIPQMYLSCEYGHHWSTYKYGNRSNTKSQYESLWLGGGYRQYISRNGYIYIGASYNVLHDKDNNLYEAWQPQVGVVFGI
ncbi:MAG: hypothetical protein ACK5MG_00430 [Bacteroidales bacterium]